MRRNACQKKEKKGRKVRVQDCKPEEKHTDAFKISEKIDKQLVNACKPYEEKRILKC